MELELLNDFCNPAGLITERNSGRRNFSHGASIRGIVDLEDIIAELCICAKP
jgi:hypothetical protein